MVDTTVFTVSAGYLPFLATKHSDFAPKRYPEKPKSYVGPGGRSKDRKYRGVEIMGPEIIRGDGSLRKARVRGSIGWFEYSTTIRPLVEDVVSQEEEFQGKLEQMAAEWYGRDQKRLSRDLLQSFIRSGALGNIIPTGEEITQQERSRAGTTPEELLDYQHRDIEVSAAPDRGLIGATRAIDMYIRDRNTGEVYRLDVTAMTFDTKEAHHGLSSHKDRLRKGVTGKQLLKSINEYGHGPGSVPQKKLWNYFRGLQSQNWNPMIQQLKDRAYAAGTENDRRMMDELTQGRNSLSKMAKDAEKSLVMYFRNHAMLEQVRGGGSKGGGRKQAAGRINPAVASEIQRLKTQKGKWDKRFKKHRRQYNNLMRAAIGQEGRRQTFNSSVAFVLHAIGNMMKVFEQRQGRHAGNEYGYSTGYGLGEGDAGNFVVEVMHRINSKGRSWLLFKALRSKDVIIHNESQLAHVYARKIIDENEITTDAIIAQASIRANSVSAAKLIADGNGVIEIGNIANAAMSQLDQTPEHQYAAVIAPTDVNDDINRFINTLTGNPKKLRDLLGTYGKTVNLTSNVKNYRKIIEQKTGAGADPASDNSNLFRTGGRNRTTTGPSAGGQAGAWWSSSNTDPELWKSQWLAGGSDPITYSKRVNVYQDRPGSAIESHSMMGRAFAKLQEDRLIGMGAGSGWEGSGGMGPEYMVSAGPDDIFGQLETGSGVMNSQRRLSPVLPQGLRRVGVRPGYWGMDRRMTDLMRENFDEQAVPDFWAAPYISLLYPAGQVTAKGE